MRTLILVACLASPGLHGQPLRLPADDGAAVEKAKIVDVRMETTAFTIEPEVPTTFVLPIKLVNNSQVQITLKDFSARFLIPPGVFDVPSSKPDAARAGALQESVDPLADPVETPIVSNDGNRDDHGMASCDYAQATIAPGGTEQVFCTFVPQVKLTHDWHIVRLLWHWRTLTFAPGDYQIYAVAEFSTAGEAMDFTKHNASNVFAIRLRPSVWQVVIGVAMGSFLLALFMTFGRRKYAEPLPPLTLAGIWQVLRPFPGLWLTGTVSGAIIVFLTYRMRESGFPISLTVNDFYGGIVVGLFSYVAAEWLKTRLLSASDDAAPRPEPEPAQLVGQGGLPP